MNRIPTFLFACAFALLPLVAAGAGQAELDFDKWLFPEYSWKEEDFQNRFLGRYGVNGYIEPQMDVENFNVYEGAMALIDDKAEAIKYLKVGIASLDASGIEASAALHFVLGSIAYEEGDKPFSIEQYVLAIRKHPTFLRAYANLGFTLMELDETEKALPVLLKAVELGANESQIHGLIGRIYAAKKLYESGLTAFRSALVFNPDNNAWRFGALQCLVGLERWAEAITLADEVIAFDRRNPSQWRNRAGILMRLERWDEAIVDFEAAHALDGSTFDSLLNLAVLYYNKGIYPSVAQTLARAVPLAQDSAALDRLLPRLQALASAKQSAAVMELLRAVEAQARTTQSELDDSLVQRIYVVHHLEKGEYQAALGLLAGLIEQSPADGELHLMQAQTLAALGEPGEAVLAYQIAATFDSTAYLANYEHARLELARGEIASALRLLRAAYAERPTEELRAHIREIEAYQADQ